MPGPPRGSSRQVAVVLLALQACCQPLVAITQPLAPLPVGQLLAPHPRLRLTPAALVVMKAKIAADPLAATVAAQLAEYGATLLAAPVVNCSLAGVEDSLLAQARSVLDRTYTLGLLYRLDGNASWARRAVKEMLHVTADPTCKSWNPSHFLDTAEMAAPRGLGLHRAWRLPPTHTPTHT